MNIWGYIPFDIADIISDNPYHLLSDGGVFISIGRSYHGDGYAIKTHKLKHQKVDIEELISIASFLVLTNKMIYGRDTEVLQKIITRYYEWTSQT